MHTKRLDSTALAAGLAAHNNGTHTWWRHPLYNYLYTDGARFFAEEGGQSGAYWFLDWVGGWVKPREGRLPFQAIKVKVSGKAATITVEDGNYRAVYSEKIPWTDLQEGTYEFWYTDNTLLLPSEY